jgi:PIN domain nuclease of toxin-antitoxin system
MNLLLDTHVFLWWNGGDDRLSNVAKDAIADPGSSVWLSAISVWEIVIKVDLGRLSVGEPPDTYVESRVRANSFRPLGFTFEHAQGVASLPALRGDPFDRALIAQARAEKLVFVTGDEALRDYPLECLW